jgi:staphylococcal nuclease domain-containing protein 1
MATAGLQYSSFTLILVGVAAPRIANARLETSTEPFGDEAREFVQVRLLHRELNISLHGTDKSGVCAVGTVHHPSGNIAVELLKNGLARISEWSASMMNTNDLPALRIAEINAKLSYIIIVINAIFSTLSSSLFITQVWESFLMLSFNFAILY